jgi:hypothetical protein
MWLCATSHYGRFGYTPWATAVELVMRYGPLHGIKLHSKKKTLEVEFLGEFESIFKTALNHKSEDLLGTFREITR